MNISKIVKDSVKSVKDTYDNTQLNPFKVPENITIKIDIAGSYADLLDAMERMDDEKAERIVKVVNKFGKIIDKVIQAKMKS
jgi:hypothetical protein